MKANKSRWIMAIPVVIATIALIVLIIQAVTPDKLILTGMVEATEIDISSKIPGRIDSLLVREGDRVQKGQLLAILESKEIDAKVEQARAAMQAARAKMEMAHNGARPEEKEAAEKLYLQAKHQLELAEKTYRRVQSVYRDSVISEQEKDQVEFQYKAAKEQFEMARAKYQMVLKGARSEEIKAAEALFRQAENAYREALAYQQETRLVSPLAGEVVRRIVDPGEMVAAGYPILTIMDPTDNWVVLQVREDQMSRIQKDAIVKGVVSALGEAKIDFRVTYIAAMADFATWRATNQKGDFDLKTFEIRLRPVQPLKGLRPGMTVRIEFQID